MPDEVERKEIGLHEGADMSELEWANLVRDIDSSFVQEKPMDKLKRKCMNEPLIPIGTSSRLTPLTDLMSLFLSSVHVNR